MKKPTFLRLTQHLLDRMERTRRPHQTKTDWIEDAMYEKAVRDEEALRASPQGK